MQFVPPSFMNLYTLRDMRNAYLSSLLPQVYHKWTREMWVYIQTQTPSTDSKVVFIPWMKPHKNRMFGTYKIIYDKILLKSN